MQHILALKPFLFAACNAGKKMTKVCIKAQVTGSRPVRLRAATVSACEHGLFGAFRCIFRTTRNLYKAAEDDWE